MNKLKNKIEYELVGDYYLPKIELSLKGFKPYSQLGKYARLRLNHLKNNNKITYQLMLMNGDLYIHLQEVQDTATTRINKLVDELAKQENITFKAKTTLTIYRKMSCAIWFMIPSCMLSSFARSWKSKNPLPVGGAGTNEIIEWRPGAWRHIES